MSAFRSAPQSAADSSASDPCAAAARPLALALVTCEAFADLFPDDAALVAALQARGFAATACVWSDPAVDWARFDAVLIRTAWDYFLRYPEFLA